MMPYDEVVEQQRQHRDIDTILEYNIYQALEMRKLKSQSVIWHSSMQKAIDERDKALAENNPGQKIPENVITEKFYTIRSQVFV